MLSPELLQEIVRRLVDEFHPERIILFGSHVWGTPSPDSDIDLLIVVPASPLPPARRAARATPVAPGLSQLLDQADRLTPYAVAYRYPGEELVPSAEEFAAALFAAEEIFACIESLLSLESPSENSDTEAGGNPN